MPGKERRSITRSEIRALLDCEAKWDFSYGDRLAGSSLQAIEPPEVLRLGSSWDAIVKAYNRREAVGPVLRAGLYMGEDNRLPKLAHRYAGMYAPMGTKEVAPFRVELYPHLDVTIQPDDLLEKDGYLWYIEYKLRKSLTGLEYLQRDLQGMLYVYGARKSGINIKGVLFDEMLNESPTDMRYKKDGGPSRVQSCSAAEYIRGCEAINFDPDPEVLARLEERRVHQRIPIDYYDYDLEEMDVMLKSVLSHVTLLETGFMFPKRVRNPMVCRFCEYNQICEHPEPDLVDFHFTRRKARRNRNADESGH